MLNVFSCEQFEGFRVTAGSHSNSIDGFCSKWFKVFVKGRSSWDLNRGCSASENTLKCLKKLD